MDLREIIKNQVWYTYRAALSPVENQAHWADSTTRQMTSPNIIIEQNKQKIEKLGLKNYFYQLDATELGNMAFMVLYHSKETEYLQNIIKQFKEFYQNEGKENINKIIEIHYQKYISVATFVPKSYIVNI